MANVNANINVNIQTQQAAAQLRKLSADISRFNQQSFAANSAAAQQQRALNQALIDGVKTSGQFRTSIVPMTSAVENFSNAIEKNKLSLGQYTRYAASQLPGMRRVFTREFDMINRVAESRVRKLNTQFIALGESANGMRTALAMTPTALDQFSARSAIALQRQQIFNRLLRDGSTQLLNWGKNTQWAGRQLMVGFTIPLGLLGAQAAKVFRELEAEAINFKKVYGDMFTTDVEVEKNLAAIKELSMEMTKYGQTAQQTMQLANTAAQSGARGAELMAATTQATRLAILGQMEQNQAIETTISLQTAFTMSNEELAESINFLNSVENQTILSLQDVSEAIPRVASVIRGFGGDVQDLSVLLVAMKEGGVSAAEGANALKNSMARVIAPTKRALETSAKYGIALQDIVARNEGKVVPLFQELAKALEAVGGQERQEILSDIFGKFQYARIGTLLSNIAREGSQAAKAIELTGVASRDLAATAERELSAVEDAVGTKFTAALEKAKIALAPVGEEFLKALTPVLDVVGKILNKFDELPGGLKTAIVAATAIIGGIAPIVLMVTGLVANGIANIGKFILFLRKQVGILRGNGEQFKYYAGAELEAAAAAASLEGKTSSLTRTMLLQRPAIETLITLYGRLAASANAAAVAMPATMGMGRLPLGLPKGGLPTLPQARPQTRNAGGSIFTADGKTVPGVGNTDKVPAMLTPGEYVVNKQASQSNLPLLEAINSGNVVGRNKGGIIPGAQYLRFGGMARLGMPRPITNPNQQRAVESQLTNWLDMQMRKTNVRELGKLLGRRQKDTELYRGMKMRPSDSGYENRFPKETQDALYRFAKTGNPDELSGLIGRPVAIAPRSFSTSEKVARTFAGDPVNVGNVKKDAAPLILKLKNEEGVFGFKPTQRIGDAKQSKRFVKEKRFYSRGSQNEREIVPVGDPRTGARMDAVVGRWGFDGKNVFIDTGAKLSRREVSRATKEFDTFTASRFTPTADITKANKDLQKLEAAFQRAKRNQGRTSSRELGDLGAQLLAQSNVRFNAGTRKDKRLVDSITKRTAKMLEETSVMFNRAKSIGLNKGGMTPEMAPTISSSLVKEWAQRKSMTLIDQVSSQTERLKANRGRMVPGTGNTDTVPAMLTPGEFVVNKEATQRNLPLIQAINNGQPVSYLSEGTQSKTSYKAPPQIRRQTESMGWTTEKAEITAAKRAAKAWGATATQIDNAILKSAAHIVSDKGPIKKWVGRNLMPDLMAVNQYMNRVPKVAESILNNSKDLGRITETLKKEGLSEARVRREIANLQKGIHPVTEKAAKVMREVAREDEKASKKVRDDAKKAGKKVAQNAKNRFGASVSGTYLAGMTRATLDARTRVSGGGPYGMRYVTPPEGYVTYRAGAKMPTPPKVAPTATVPTGRQASAAQSLARQIKRNNPRLTSAQSLNLARLQLGRQQKQAISGLQGMGGGGGRTPTFLGMPGMPEQPRQSMMGRINSGVGRFGMGAGMALSMGSMLPMMNQNEQGKFMGMDAGTAMMGMMGGGMLLSIAPMLGKAALPVIAIGAVAAGVGLALKAWRNNVDGAAKKTAELGANIGGTSNALNTMANLFGELTPSQRRTKFQLGFTEGEQEESFGQFQNYLGSEQGQKFIKDLKDATSAERFVNLSSYVSNAIAAGILDKNQARLFVKTISTTLGDAVLGSTVLKAIEDQKEGAEGLLELAEKRLSAVEKSVAVDRLRSEATIEETDASSVIGSSIQIIQDFSNVAALAKEEYVAGTISFEEYRKVVDRSKTVQENYSKAMEVAFKKTEDFGATMQAWKDQLTLAGKDQETIEIFQRSATRTDDPTTGFAQNALSYINPLMSMQRGYQGARQLFGGQATFGNVANAFLTGAYQEINEEILSAMTQASLTGEYNDADLAVIAQKIMDEPRGALAKTFEKYGKGERGLGRALFEERMANVDIPGLSEKGKESYINLAFNFDERIGDYADVEAFINSIPEEIRTKIVVDLEGKTDEEIADFIFDQAEYTSMFGEDVAARIAAARSSGLLGASPEVKKPEQRREVVVPKPKTADRQRGSNRRRTKQRKPEVRLNQPTEEEVPVTDEEENLIKVEQSKSRLSGGGVIGREEALRRVRAAKSGYTVNPNTGESYTAEGVAAQRSVEQEYLDRPISLPRPTGPSTNELNEQRFKEQEEAFETQAKRIYDLLGEPGGEALVYAIDIQVKGGDYAANTLKKIGDTVEFIEENIPKDRQISMGIDTTNIPQMADLAPYREQLLGISELIATMPEEEQAIASRIAISVVDGENKPLSAEELASQTQEILKAVKNLDSENLEVEKQATLTVIQSMENPDGSRVTPEEAEEYMQGWMDEFSDKQFSALNEFDIQTLVNLESKINGAEEALAALEVARAMSFVQYQGNPPEEILAQFDTQIAALKGALAGYNAAKTNVARGAARRSSGSDRGGGGGKESPLKGFLENILNQVKMWTDASAKMGDLNNARSSFVDQVLKGEGLFDKLKNLKGLSAGMLEQVIAMGPEGAEDFIKKYGQKGALTQAGRNLLNAESAARINQTVGMNVLGAEQKRMQTRAASRLRNRGASDEVIQAIAGDAQKSADYLKLERATRKGTKEEIRQAKKDLEAYLKAQQDIVDATREEEKSRRSIKEITQERFDVINLDFDMQEFETRKRFEEEFAQANGQTVKEMERAIDAKNDEIEAQEKIIDLKQEEIDKLNRANELDQRRIESHNEQIDKQQDIIDAKERQNELDQREIEKLSRQDEIRQRTADALQRELELMSETEDEIRETYDKRIKALDQVSKLNTHIINQQRQQIDLSRALSEGDVYAAAQAAEQMRQSSAEFAIDQTRVGLEQSMENEIGSLRTSQGLTREQAEQQIKNIKDQSYQTSLLIRDIEDRIYQRNLEMIPLQDEIYRIKNELIKPIEDQIAQRNLEIRDYSDQIYDISTGIVAERTKERDALVDILDNYERKLGYAIADLTVAGKTRQQWDDIQIATDLYLAKKENLDAMNKTWESIVANMTAAALLAPQIGAPSISLPGGKKNYAGGLIKYAGGGFVPGSGGMDSISSMLMPGEFVIRKAMVDKYGIPMLENINQGSFSMPRYNMGTDLAQPVVANSTSVSNINAPVYNTYDMRFNISGANANADEIAHKVMTKIRNVDSASIRRINGY